MTLTVPGMVMEDSEEQKPNAREPITVTPVGILTKVNAEQKTNAESPMIVILPGMVMEDRAKQLSNAEFPMTMTVSGITAVVIGQSLKAPSTMALNPGGNTAILQVQNG